MVKLNVLDYAQIDEGSNPVRAVQESAELAQYAESLGYHRYWVAEHHNLPAFASSSPELLMMHIADKTEKIRVGSGGVMLPHYSPYKVSENFRVLQAAHPDRIDFGIGNTVGTETVNAAINENKEKKLGYEQAIKDIKHYLTDDEQDDFRFGNLIARPKVDDDPEFWLLSTSVRNAKLAARLGIGYCFGFFPYSSNNKIEIAKEAAKTYREEFQPNSSMSEPKVMFAIFAAIGETEEDTEAVAKSIDLWMLGQNNFTQFSEFPSIETAANYKPTDEEKEKIEENRTRLLVGSKDTVREKLDGMVNEIGADEVLLCTIMPSIENRKKGLRILAEAYN